MGKHHQNADHEKFPSTEEIGLLAEAAVEKAEAFRSSTTGAERHTIATEALVKALDKAIKFPATPLGVLAEIGDGPALRFLIIVCGRIIEDAFQKWQARRAARDDE